MGIAEEMHFVALFCEQCGGLSDEDLGALTRRVRPGVYVEELHGADTLRRCEPSG